jgi:hypothetical protein
MNMKAVKRAVIMVMLSCFVASMSPVSAQGPLRKQVEFTINSAFEMNNSEVVLPAGKYILFQVHQNDLNLFALYKDSLMHSPVAMVRTIRIVNTYGEYPDKFQMLMDMDEETDGALPVITGWAVPGDDGWEIMAMVPDRDRIVSTSISKANRKKVKVHMTAKATGF